MLMSYPVLIDRIVTAHADVIRLYSNRQNSDRTKIASAELTRIFIDNRANDDVMWLAH